MNAKLPLIGLVAAAAMVAPAQAATNLVTNGSFENAGGGGQIGFNTTLAGWNVPGYADIFTAGSADTTGITDFGGKVKLWGPNDGSNNGLTAASPDGGNFLAVDSSFTGFDGQPGNMAISQTLNGLTAGSYYTVSFYWAGAEQTGFSKKSTEQWTVGFGSQTQSTPVVNVAAKGFTGWMQQSFTFQADGTSDVLSFLAVGGPEAAPPFALLDGITVTAIPEPEAWALMILGFGIVGGLQRRRRALDARRALA